MAVQNKKRRKAKKKSLFKRLLPYVLILLIAAILIAAVIYVTGMKGDNKELYSGPIELEHTTEAVIENKAKLEQDTNPAIAELITRYFQAVKTADADTLNQIVESDTRFDPDKLEKEAQIYEGYSNISCYSTPGILDKTYITYVYYEVKLKGIDTKAPSLVRFYICENEDGTMYINQRKQDGEVNTFMNEVAGWQEIKDLVTMVNNRMREACESDENLQKFVDMLNGNSSASDSTKKETSVHEVNAGEVTEEESTAEE